MNLEEFPEQTVVIAKDQPEYRPLPAYRYKDDPQGTIVCCWSLTWRERLRVLVTGKLWHSILTFNQSLQPQRLEVEKPNMPPHVPPPEYFDTQCECGEQVTVETNSPRTMRKDGKRVFHPDHADSDECLFRCQRCGKPLHETVPEAAFPPGTTGTELI